MGVGVLADLLKELECNPQTSSVDTLVLAVCESIE